MIVVPCHSVQLPLRSGHALRGRPTAALTTASRAGAVTGDTRTAAPSEFLVAAAAVALRSRLGQDQPETVGGTHGRRIAECREADHLRMLDWVGGC
jgi:hypothetical protein